MTLYDKQLKSTALKLGICLLVFFALFEVFFGVVQTLLWHLLLGALGEELAYDVSELLNAMLYLLAFSIPALIYGILARKDNGRAAGLTVPPPKETPLVVIAVIGIILSVSQINAVMVSHFEFYEYMLDLLEPDGRMDLVDFVIAVIGSALVPAICEELLFRVTVQGALAPYGKTFAIIASALLFGLMHQNPVQILYATAAGILLGYAYDRTRSYLCVFLIHFINNFFSVIQQALYANLDEDLASRIYVPTLTLVVLLGIISAFILVFKAKKKKTPYDTGSYGVILKETDGYIERPVGCSAAKKFFLSPTVLIFTILCIVNTVSWLILPLG